MKRIVATALLALACTPFARAQVELQLTAEQQQFLPAEELIIAVRIANFTGRNLRLGGNPEWLTFTVEATDGGVVAKLSEVPADVDYQLESATRSTFRVDLAPHFQLDRTGRYRVTATMTLPAIEQQVTSSPLTFDIVGGSILWEQPFGVPPSAGNADAPPEQRKYLLQQANHLKRLRLYVRITDERESKTHRVLSIGGMVSFTKPEPVVDRRGRLHVLHQFGAKTYGYHLISPDGTIAVRRTYDIAENRPKLRVNEDGEVVVVGGVRRITSADLPAPASDEPNPPLKDDSAKEKKS